MFLEREVWREERASAAQRKNDGETKSVHLFSFFLLLCATRRKREKNKQKRRFTHSLSLSLLPGSGAGRVRFFFSSFSLQKVERNTSPKLRLLHVKGYCLGCKFKFRYSLKCFFQGFGGYLLTTFVSAQVVLFFQRRFWTARNTEILISLSWFPGEKKKGIINSRRSPFILNPHALCKRKEHTHTHTL